MVLHVQYLTHTTLNSIRYQQFRSCVSELGGRQGREGLLGNRGASGRDSEERGQSNETFCMSVVVPGSECLVVCIVI